MIPSVLRAADDLGPCREAFLAALLARDGQRARGVVTSAVSAGTPVASVYLEVLQPSLASIGHEWAVGGITVAEEHFATAVVEQLVAELAGRARIAPFGGRMAIMACTPGELHGLGARMVSGFLEADGWEVLHLGASTPAEDLVGLIDAEAPDVVALSTSTAGRLPGVTETLQAVAAIRPRPLIVVGGLFWTAETSPLAVELGADLVTRDPRALVARLRDAVPPRED